jgi:PAS domain S-box-containing protein
MAEEKYISLENEIQRLRLELETYKQKEDENIYKTFIASSPDIIIWVDENYRYKFIHIPNIPSDRLQRLIGQDMLASTPEAFHDKMISALEKVFRDKETVVYESEAFSMGSYKYYLNYLTPIFNNNQQVNGAYFVSRDITIQKEKEKVVNELNLNLVSLFESLPHIYTVFDLNQNVLWFNKEANRLALCIFQKSLAIGLNASDLFPEYIYESFSSQFDKSLNGEIIKYERKFQVSDGSVLFYEMTLQPICQDGKVIAVANVGIDITQMVLKEEKSKKINQELVIQNQQLNQFSHIISHNLRSPISTMMGIANVIDIYRNDQALVNNLLQKVVTTAEKLDGIIKDLNEVLNQSGSDKKNFQLVNLSEIVEIIVSLNESKDVTIRTDFIDVPVIYSIKSYIYSILFNLISNAIKYKKADHPACIQIRSECNDDEHILIRVRDNGMGIDLDKYGDKLFGFYKRFHFHVEGKGLGLHITKNQVDFLGGTISVQSKPDEGCEFTVMLPKINSSEH